MNSTRIWPAFQAAVLSVLFVGLPLNSNAHSLENILQEEKDISLGALVYRYYREANLDQRLLFKRKFIHPSNLFFKSSEKRVRYRQLFATVEKLIKADNGKFRSQEMLFDALRKNMPKLTHLGSRVYYRPANNMKPPPEDAVIEELYLDVEKQIMSQPSKCPSILEAQYRLINLCENSLNQTGYHTLLDDPEWLLEDRFGCGYNTMSDAYFKVHFRCDPTGSCFSQAAENNPLDCVKFVPDQRRPGIYFQEGTSCANDRSYRDGGRYGDMVLISLGEYYLRCMFQIEKDSQGNDTFWVYYAGLVLPFP